MQEKSGHRISEIPVAEGRPIPRTCQQRSTRLSLAIRKPPWKTIRVSVTVLDRLMNLVGELVLARNQLLQFSKI